MVDMKSKMESFQWSDAYLTGIDAVDEQHHNLIKIINRLGEMLGDSRMSKDDIEKVFGELLEYTDYHFRDEEYCMEATGVDVRHIELHKQSHSDFLAEVIRYHKNTSYSKPGEKIGLVNFLIHWLGFHILGTDQNMARQIKAIESGLSPADAYDAEEKNMTASMEPLIVALNGLFNQVSESNRELQILNDRLEEKVLERTKELNKANKLLEGLALTDALTNLPNRRHAVEMLDLLWEEAIASKSSTSCMMIDADHFKEVNDNYGHDAGDMVLQELARSLKGAVRTDDFVSRLGGDEFFIICPKTGEDGVLRIAEEILKTVNKLVVSAGGGEWQGSVSLGVATQVEGMKDSKALLKAADKALYKAKQAGKNCIRVY